MTLNDSENFRPSFKDYVSHRIVCKMIVKQCTEQNIKFKLGLVISVIFFDDFVSSISIY